MSLDPAIDLSLRCAFFALFASALAHKVLRFETFRLTVAAYVRGTALASGAIVTAGAGLVMLGEAAAVAACLAPGDRPLSAGVVAGMLLVYAAAMGANLLRGNTLLDCGCNWGSQRQPVGYGLVWRNVALAIVALVLVLPVGARSLQAFDFVTILGSSLLAALIYAGSNLLLARAALTTTGAT